MSGSVALFPVHDVHVADVRIDESGNEAEVSLKHEWDRTAGGIPPPARSAETKLEFGQILHDDVLRFSECSNTKSSASENVRVVCARCRRRYFGGSTRAGLPTTRVPAGTSRKTTVPAPVAAPSPMASGATSDELEPMNTSLPIDVRCLRSPS